MRGCARRCGPQQFARFQVSRFCRSREKHRLPRPTSAQSPEPRIQTPPSRCSVPLSPPLSIVLPRPRSFLPPRVLALALPGPGPGSFLLPALSLITPTFLPARSGFHFHLTTHLPTSRGLGPFHSFFTTFCLPFPRLVASFDRLTKTTLLLAPSGHGCDHLSPSSPPIPKFASIPSASLTDGDTKFQPPVTPDPSVTPTSPSFTSWPGPPGTYPTIRRFIPFTTCRAGLVPHCCAPFQQLRPPSHRDKKR